MILVGNSIVSDHSYQIKESCFSQEFHYASLCGIPHDFPVTLHTPAYGQWSVSDHNGDK